MTASNSNYCWFVLYLENEPPLYDSQIAKKPAIVINSLIKPNKSLKKHKH